MRRRAACYAAPMVDLFPHGGARGAWRLLLALLAGLLLVSGAGPSAAASFGRGVLWKVEFPGAAPSYLFGTIHSDDDRVLARAAALEPLIARSRVFAAELIDDDEATRSVLRAMMAESAGLPASLGDDWPEVEAQLAERGIPREALASLKPWGALIVLLQPRGATARILDRELQERARVRRKPIEPLETVAEQIAVFDRLAEPVQLALLRHAARHQDELQGAFVRIVEAWLEGDLEAIWQLNAEPMRDPDLAREDSELFLERVLFERNRRFVERLLPQLRRGGVFAAFGALHLYGERGVLAELARRGARVNPVTVRGQTRTAVTSPRSP